MQATTSQRNTAQLLLFYGFFLMLCGFLSLVLVGAKALTGLLAGAGSGFLALTLAYFMTQGRHWSFYGGLVASLLFLLVFSSRAMNAFLVLIKGQVRDTGEVIPAFDETKAIGFLLLSCMFIVSLIVLAIQFMFLRSNLSVPDKEVHLTM